MTPRTPRTPPIPRAPRASLTAEICFGPVPFLVKLYSVASERTVSLSQVHAKCGGRLEQQYVCPAEGEVVPRHAFAKQYRLPDGTVATLTDEDIKTAESDRIGTLEILEFIPDASVDPIYLGKAMLLGPGDAIDPYSLFVDALAETRTAAVGIHYTKTRDQLVLIERYRTRGLLLRELFYASEIRALDEIELPGDTRGPVLPEAFKRWTDAIERRRKGALEPGAHEDGYPERLRLAAERKGRGDEAPAEATRSADLMRAARKRAVSGPVENARRRAP